MRQFSALLLILLLTATSCSTLHEMQQSRIAALPIPFDQTATLTTNLEAPTQTELATKQLRNHMAKVAAQLTPSPWQVTKLRKGEVVKLQLPIQQLFEPNDTLLSAQAMKPLAALRPYLSERYHVAIVSHSDNTGSESYTQRLSEQRAHAVTNWLVENGFSLSSIATYPMGSTQPLLPNTSVTNRAKNRRIEIYLLPTTTLLEELRQREKR